MNQVLYLVGLHNSTPTIACALTNLLPALTFILAVPFGLESVGIKRKAGQAKIFGTVVCVGGAMLLSLYHGRTVNRGIKHSLEVCREHGERKLYQPCHQLHLGPHFNNSKHCLLGNMVQYPRAKMSEKYAAPNTTLTLVCLMAIVQCGIIGFCADHNISAWSLTPGIRAFSSIYGGIVYTAAAFYLMCIQRKGSCLIVMGLYAVLWGKNKEMNAKNNAEDRGEEKQE
ncbi:unnamed protein product [Camellia sinensis]